MYHADDAHIITTDEITRLPHLSLHTDKHGTRYAHIVAELAPGKEYTEDGLRLHLTNGVTHRYLFEEGDIPEAERVGEEQEAEGQSTEEVKTSDEGSEEPTVPPVTPIRKQHKKG